VNERSHGREPRVTIVASQALGYGRCGGPGVATTYLGLGLARAGHRVEILHVGEPAPIGVDPAWARRYEQAGLTVRVLPRSERRVEPHVLARPRDVASALAQDPPDVVIAEDFAAPAYVALQLRRLGLGFERTLFAVFCHGTWRLAKLGRRVEIQPRTLLLDRLEQACVELADVAVSPSRYLLDFMAGQAWRLPARSEVIPHVTEAVALDADPPRLSRSNEEAPVERIAYFGRLEERKGIRPFLDGLNAVRPELLQGLGLVFVGRSTKGWTPERVESSLAPRVKDALTRVTFETDLDQHGALTELSRPGTLAVLPALAENSPVAIYECVEWGVPFVASDVGGIAELISPRDRERTLFEPTARGVASALERALTDDAPLRPVHPAFDGSDSVARWSEILREAPRPPVSPRPGEDVDVIARDEREAGLSRGRSPWVLLLDADDDAAPELVDTLLRAQAASGADVVTCGLDLGEHDQLFIGEPAALGLLSNAYGCVALVRRSLLAESADGLAGRADWPLLASLGVRGAKIVSAPLALVRSTASPETLESRPGEALLVTQELERVLPESASGLARLAAGLAADSARSGP
jgi:glycosyltransferase involved in cell wall biosynthesis